MGEIVRLSKRTKSVTAWPKPRVLQDDDLLVVHDMPDGAHVIMKQRVPHKVATAILRIMHANGFPASTKMRVDGDKAQRRALTRSNGSKSPKVLRSSHRGCTLSKRPSDQGSFPSYGLQDP